MNLVIPKPSELNRLFWDKYEEGPKVATDAFYKIALDLNLIKVRDIAKNISFKLTATDQNCVARSITLDTVTAQNISAY